MRERNSKDDAPNTQAIIIGGSIAGLISDRVVVEKDKFLGEHSNL
jgi:hypothetical protein